MDDRQKGRLAHEPGAAGLVAGKLEDQPVVHVDRDAVPSPGLGREDTRGEVGEDLDDHSPQDFRVQRRSHACVSPHDRDRRPHNPARRASV